MYGVNSVAACWKGEVKVDVARECHDVTSAEAVCVVGAASSEAESSGRGELGGVIEVLLPELDVDLVAVNQVFLNNRIGGDSHVGWLDHFVR